MQDDHDLDGAYALKTPEDSVRYYRDWADSYDTAFAGAMDYVYPAAVAERFAELAGATDSPVLDIGAGTGLVGAELGARGIARIDALDISGEMLAVAMGKGCYRDRIVADLTAALAIDGSTYGGLVSAGTFTHGHVGPVAFDELLRVARPGALFVIGINAAVYESAGFRQKFAELAPGLRDFRIEEARIYGESADPAHRGDTAQLAIFRKA